MQPSWLPDLRRWIGHPHVYLSQHYALVAVAVTAEVLVAILLALVGGELTAGQHRHATARPQDTLWHLFHEEMPGHVPYASLRTAGGMVFQGPVSSQDSAGNRADRHLVIGPPLMRAPAGIELADSPAPWDQVVVALENVDHFYVTFLPKASQETGRQQRRRRKGFSQQSSEALVPADSKSASDEVDPTMQT